MLVNIQVNSTICWQSSSWFEYSAKTNPIQPITDDQNFDAEKLINK